MSMNPGATTRSEASIVSRAAPSSGPIAAILSPTIATSAGTPGEPVPSTTTPPRISTS
jgi:hypothetical protein